MVEDLAHGRAPVDSTRSSLAAAVRHQDTAGTSLSDANQCEVQSEERRPPEMIGKEMRPALRHNLPPWVPRTRGFGKGLRENLLNLS